MRKTACYITYKELIDSLLHTREIAVANISAMETTFTFSLFLE
jgi:hypothetical protein